MTYEYKIGTSRDGMVTLDILGVPAPHNEFVPFSLYLDLGNGGARGHGWASDEWLWGFVTQTQRDALKAYIPDAGAHIFVRDLKDDGLTWRDFECEAIWPQREVRTTGHRIPFAIVLRAMIELEEPEP